MNTNTHDKQIVLGAEYDQALRRRLLDVLRSLGAKPTNQSFEVGGSQELQTLTALVGSRTIRVESETYIGLTITGDPELVEEVAARVHGHLA